MFTDIVGFTNLSAKDENKALALLDKQEEILYPIIEKFNGVVHKNLGDGLLITFSTVTEAVKCAIESQQTLKSIEDLDIMAMALAELDSETVQKLQDYLPGKKAAMFTPKTEEDSVSKREIDEAKGQIKNILQKKIDSGELNIDDVLAVEETVEE